MPEEHNRVLTDHAADLLLAPTRVAMDHLAREGLADRAELVGDVMTDVLLRTRDAVAGDPSPLPEDLRGAEYLVSTVHRAENTDDPERLRAVVAALAALPLPVVLLAHPRLVARAASTGTSLSQGAIRVMEPMNYPAMVAAVSGARGVVTDSGGLQKEAYLLGTPCTTLRPETEWPETLEGGWNVLSPEAAELAPIVMRPRPAQERGTPYGDGHAAVRVAEVLVSRR
jgi:UDP-N-acetylglucosamine 2-epimerase (non-hydrolysing)